MAADVDLTADPAEAARTRCRALVARIESELAELRDRSGADESHGLANLFGAWADLVDELALGAEPSMRSCPNCRRSILTVAVRCRYCMVRSPAEGGRA